MVIYCPMKFDVHCMQGLLNQLAVSTLVADITIDFRPVGFVEPFATLVIAHALRAYVTVRGNKNLGTKFLGTETVAGAVGYLKHLGFFRFIGLKVGNGVGEVPGGPRFLPLTTIRTAQIMWKGHVMQQEIDNKADRLSRVIFPGKANDGASMMLAYCLREIIRNSFEHGGVSRCVAMAQRWQNGEAEIAIGDEGIGVHASLSRVRRYSSPDEAIASALLPGVTSGSVKDDPHWANSGFGLYVVSELGKRFGEFAIVSSARLLSFHEGMMTIKQTPVYGTFVKLRVTTRDADYFPNILAQIVEAGEQMLSTVEGAVRSASKMSKTPIVVK